MLPIYHNAAQSRHSLFSIRTALLAAVFSGLASVGIGVVSFSIRDYRTALVSTTWDTSSATAIEESREGLLRLNKGRYIYYADGRPFVGKRVRFFVNNRLLNPAPPKVFSVTEEFEVFVHPENPAFSVVVTGGSGIGFAILLVTGAIAFFFGAGGLIRTLLPIAE